MKIVQQMQKKCFQTLTILFPLNELFREKSGLSVHQNGQKKNAGFGTVSYRIISWCLKSKVTDQGEMDVISVSPSFALFYLLAVLTLRT